MEGLFPDEDYPVAVFVRTFAVKDLPATEVGNLLLDSFELDIEFVGEASLFHQLGKVPVRDAVVDIGNNGMEG